MLEDFRLKVFMAVAENRSFTKAAAVLRITQPAVSQNIAELEKTVGSKLFDRLKGETVLTTEGRVFMEYANACWQYVPQRRICSQNSRHRWSGFQLLKKYTIISYHLPSKPSRRCIRRSLSNVRSSMMPIWSSPFAHVARLLSIYRQTP